MSTFLTMLTTAAAAAAVSVSVFAQRPATVVEGNEIKLSGCVTRTDPSAMTSGSVLAWTRGDLLLSRAVIEGYAVGTSGVAGPAGVVYYLDKGDELAKHIGHFVEVKGDLEDIETGRVKIDRKGDFTEVKIKLDGDEDKVRVPTAKRKGPRYTPISRRNERPGAIKWLLRNHPELKDSQIMRLVGTTKSTIQAVRDRTHWNSPNLQPMDPVTLGLCSQTDLDFEVHRASKEKPLPSAEHATLLPASETTAHREPEPEPEERREERKEEAPIDVESVFARLGGGKKSE